jgi:preprotein translocase subunit SecD
MTAFRLLHVTLTLPGLAGIILSIGMAVDANVLIFERYKEELRNGKTIKNAIEGGFQRAIVTIVDSNVTTLLTAFVLFWLGTGTIKGFAVTLSIGIIISMFTAISLTKFFLFSSLNITKIRESNLIRFK